MKGIEKDLEHKLNKLSSLYNIPFDSVLSIYECRHKNLIIAFGKEYKGRESHLIFRAYKGTKLCLEEKFKYEVKE